MINILFYYDNRCSSHSKGGTEIATSRIAAAISKNGEFEAFNAYLHGNSKAREPIYKAEIKLRKPGNLFIRDLSSFISENKIDAIVNMGRFFRHGILQKAIKASGRDVKLLFMHHFAPGSEKKKSTYSAGLHLFKLNPINPIYWLRATVYPILKLPRRLRWKQIYAKVAEESDAIVVLSEGYKEGYANTAGTLRANTMDKFHAIPNIFDADISRNNLHKEKRVLILSRMDEIQKRISLALKIWSKIEETGEFKDWKLDIVGNGHEYKSLKKLASKLKLKNVVFHGWQNGKIFLEKSPILISTSEYEGLSLSMIEAQSYGCVPVAFDAYASLRDLVHDGENGIIIDKFGDIDTFALKLADLMRSEEAREKMGNKAINSTSKFSSDSVGEKWIEMLNSLK